MSHPEYQHKSSIAADGSRQKIRPADVDGTFNRAKRFVYPLLALIFALIPWIRWGDHPILLFDIEHRQFFIAGQTFNAQDFYLVFFLITGAAFSLFFITALFGRVWCGWSCPQTFFLEGIFRRLERWIEGPRAAQLRLATQPWNFEKIGKFAAKHILFLFFSFLIASTFLSYFNSTEKLLRFFREGIVVYPLLTAWLLVLTTLIYINFAWFREQLCLIVCPYGRLQSVLTDDDSIVIGYDQRRGEPRGKKDAANRGDCIDCGRCVAVCPTGIDIRVGLQMECIGCANCIDACNDIMFKIGQKSGLIRYDSLNGLEGKARRILRPRIYLYTLLLGIGMVVFSVFAFQRQPFEANLLRLTGLPYRLENGKVINQYEIHLVNKEPRPTIFTINAVPMDHLLFTIPVREIALESLTDRRLPIFAEIPEAVMKKEFSVTIQVREKESGLLIEKHIAFLGPVKP